MRYQAADPSPLDGATPYNRTEASRPELLCPQVGHGTRDGDPLLTPIVQSTTFSRSGVGSDPPHQYSRVSNPTVATLEQALGALEEALPAACFGTGLAAETALFLSVLKAGDHVVCGRCVYGGTTRLLQRLLPDLGIETTFVDSTDLAAVGAAIRHETKLVFVETPANPTLDLTDVRGCKRAIQEAGSRALLAVDNTFLTPVLQRPLDLGADVSVYSTTKLMEGHSVALGGALVTRDESLLDRVRFLRKCTGAIQAPFNSWLALNGLKTLPLRAREQSRSAAVVAGWLGTQEGIEAVFYPTLAGTGARAIAEAQHRGGHGVVVTFEVRGGLAAGRRFVEALRVCTLVEHVGSVETLITHPASMTHADVPPDQREAVGVSDGLLRLSVGLEPVDAILADLARGLAAAAERGSEKGSPGEEKTCLAGA